MGRLAWRHEFKLRNNLEETQRNTDEKGERAWDTRKDTAHRHKQRFHTTTRGMAPRTSLVAEGANLTTTLTIMALFFYVSFL